MTEEQLIEKYYKMGQDDGKVFNSIKEAVNYTSNWEHLSRADTGMMIAYEAGLTGAEMPRKVTGWRYGHLPACGYSYNYAESRPEAGVSLMETDCGLKSQDKLSGLFIAGKNRPVVKVTGWLNTVETGSDGEPLVFWAKEIK